MRDGSCVMYEDEDGNKDGENEEIKDFLGSGCADIWILL